jgi:hypothetical protein
MLDLHEINRVAERAVLAVLNGRGVSRVYSRPTLDSVGNDALRVNVVLEDGIVKEVTDDDALGMIVRILDDLETSGEE